jgi:hypothetical protein
MALLVSVSIKISGTRRIVNEINNQLGKVQLCRSLLKKRQSILVEQWREKSDRLFLLLTAIASSPMVILMGKIQQ